MIFVSTYPERSTASRGGRPARFAGNLIFFAQELHISRVYFSLQLQCLFMTPKLIIRARKISLRNEHVVF